MGEAAGRGAHRVGTRRVTQLGQLNVDCKSACKGAGKVALAWGARPHKGGAERKSSNGVGKSLVRARVAAPNHVERRSKHSENAMNLLVYEHTFISHRVVCCIGSAGGYSAGCCGAAPPCCRQGPDATSLPSQAILRGSHPDQNVSG